MEPIFSRECTRSSRNSQKDTKVVTNKRLLAVWILFHVSSLKNFIRFEKLGDLDILHALFYYFFTVKPVNIFLSNLKLSVTAYYCVDRLDAFVDYNSLKFLEQWQIRHKVAHHLRKVRKDTAFFKQINRDTFLHVELQMSFNMRDL